MILRGSVGSSKRCSSLSSRKYLKKKTIFLVNLNVTYRNLKAVTHHKFLIHVELVYKVKIES